MTIDRRSRYWGLPTFLHEGLLTAALRTSEPTDADEPFAEHRLTDTETLDQLALRYYGREDLWWRIADANPRRFPMDWQPGDVLRIPLSRRVTRTPRTSATSAASS